MQVRRPVGGESKAGTPDNPLCEDCGIARVRCPDSNGPQGRKCRVCWADAESRDITCIVKGSATHALPGSLEKIKVMRRRIERGEQLFHPLDATWSRELVDGLCEALGLKDGEDERVHRPTKAMLLRRNRLVMFSWEWWYSFDPTLFPDGDELAAIHED